MDVNQLILGAEDMSLLSQEQKDAVLEALFLAAGIDREVQPEEAQVFNQEVARIPWASNPEELQPVLRNAAARRKGADAGQNVAWVKEIAAKLPDLALREKILATMVRIAMADELNAAERGLLGMAAIAFELPQESLEHIRQILLSS